MKFVDASCRNFHKHFGSKILGVPTGIPPEASKGIASGTPTDMYLVAPTVISLETVRRIHPRVPLAIPPKGPKGMHLDASRLGIFDDTGISSGNPTGVHN